MINTDNLIGLRLRSLTVTLRHMVDRAYRDYVDPGIMEMHNGIDVRNHVIAAAANLNRFFEVEKPEQVDPDIEKFVLDTLDFYTQWRVRAYSPFSIFTGEWFKPVEARTDEDATKGEIRKRIKFLQSSSRYESDEERRESEEEIERLKNKLGV